MLSNSNDSQVRTVKTRRTLKHFTDKMQDSRENNFHHNWFLWATMSQPAALELKVVQSHYCAHAHTLLAIPFAPFLLDSNKLFVFATL